LKVNEEMLMTARDKAGDYFKSGYNCAEAVLRAYLDMYPQDFGNEVARLASALGGGMGRSGCACGALTASEMVLGMLAGRDSQTSDLKHVYKLSGELHNRFKEKFGSTCCRVLNKEDYQSQEHARRCLKITGGTAMLLMQFLLDHNLPAGRESNLRQQES
jgi:C_GCAxxG_C_C family probable redox protein